MPTYNPYTDSHAIEKYQFLHHFLPHPDTKKRAKLLSHSALLFYSLLIVLIIGLFKLVPLLAPGVLGYASNISVTSLLDMTNELRKGRNMEELRLSPVLTRAAEAKARHMFEYDYWAHIAPDGTTPWDFILGEEYDYTFAGENLAKNFGTSRAVLVAWDNSPSHRENILNSSYKEVGFAVIDGVLEGYETTLVVQVFGRQRDDTLVATALEEENLLESIEVTSNVAKQPSIVVPSASYHQGTGETVILPAVDIPSATKSISLSIAGFLFILLALDIWYTRKKAIPKITGHAFAHVLVLVVTIVGVWFALSPGKIL